MAIKTTKRAQLTSNIIGKLSNTIAKDLVTIGEAVMKADRAERRGVRIGKQTRHLDIFVRLHHADTFIAIIPQLEAFCNFVTRDRWRVEVKERKSVKTSSACTELPETFRKPVISLFSDGLDSLCGAIQLFSDKTNPIFVAHAQPQWGFSSMQNRITDIQSLSEHFSQAHGIVNYVFNFPEGLENSRRARPVLYLCYAAATAIELNVAEIRLNENGILAYNLPYDPAIAGAAISRHAHPQVLKRFESILKDVWPHKKTKSQVSIINPFIGMTKAAEVKQIVEDFPDADKIMAKTVSCENAARALLNLKGKLSISNPKRLGSKECGICTPCLVRRYALGTSHITEHDLHYFYSDKRAANAPLPKIRNATFTANQYNPLRLKTFCEKLLGLSLGNFVIYYLPELAFIIQPDDGFGEQSKLIYQLHQTFAREYLTYLKK